MKHAEPNSDIYAPTVNMYQYNGSVSGDHESMKEAGLGMELIEDHNLGIHHAFYRTYDPQLGRMMQVDPMAEEPDLVSMTPYNSFLNSPTVFSDPNGDEIEIDGTKEDRKAIMGALKQLTSDKIKFSKSTNQVEIKKERSGNKQNGTKLVSNLVNDKHTTTISIGEPGSTNYTEPASGANVEDITNGTGVGANVNLDPTENLEAATENTETGDVSMESVPFEIAVGHELIHADHFNNGDIETGTERHDYPMPPYGTFTQWTKKEELRTVGLKRVKAGDVTENQLRKEHKNKAVKRTKRMAY